MVQRVFMQVFNTSVYLVRLTRGYMGGLENIHIHDDDLDEFFINCF